MPGEDPRQAGNADSGGDREFVMARIGAVRQVVRRLTLRTVHLLASPVLLCFSVRLAEAEETIERSGPAITAVDVIQLASFAGVMGAALLSAIFLIRERTRTAAENLELRGRIADLNAALQRSDALLNLRDQRVLVWTSERRKPELIGNLPVESGAPDERAAFLAFGRWLMPRSAAALEHAMAALRDKGLAFDLVIEAQNGAPIEVQGRKSASHVVVRFLSVSETQRLQARLKLENHRLAVDQENVLGLLDALDMPFWLRHADGSLKWVNRAYARSVEAAGPDAVIRDGKELLGTQAREAIARQHLSRPVFQQALSTVIEGDRHVLAVSDFAGGEGSAGIAADRSEIEAMRAEHERTVRSHADTLDQLTTAVAIFDSHEKLRFFNQAFLKLWDLDQAFLASAPDNALLVDRLRSEGKIAEQPEWRRWKETLLSAYRAVESQVHWWHLPDGRTIRVVANPQPNNGVTWIFENLTEKMNLESRYNTAVRVQGETLDNLAEGVAVFGPDGRIRLSNPAFNTLWGFSEDLVGAECSHLDHPGPLRCSGERQSLAGLRRLRHRLRRGEAGAPGPGGTRQRRRASIFPRAPAERPGHDHLRGRDRQRQHRAGAQADERSAREG